MSDETSHDTAIGALVVALVVVGYLYYERTRSDITIQLPEVELNN